MAKLSYEEIKSKKNFYRDHYRGVVVALILSFTLSFALILIIVYKYMSQAEPRFYATNGETSPIELIPSTEPNMTNTHLLPPDPIEQP